MSGERGTINLTPVERWLEARQLDQLIQLWMDDCRLRLSRNTCESYRHSIGYFRAWWAEVGQGLKWELREKDIRTFTSYLETVKTIRSRRALAYNTRKDVLRRLAQVFHWAYPAYVEFDYSSWVPEPTGSAPLRKATPVDHLRKLMLATGETGKLAVRNRAILAVLIGTGVRRSECSSINIEDIQIDADCSGMFKVKAKRVRSREIHERNIAFDSFTGKHIRAHMDTLTAQSGPFFIGLYGDPLEPVAIYKVVTRMVAIAGLVGQVQGPHDLRRAFATHFAKTHPGEGYGALLSKQLGHSSYKMTSQYTLHDIEDVRAVLVSPFALMELSKD